MKNLITNFGRGLAASAFKNSITNFVLIGASTNNDTGLSGLLDKDTSIVKDFNINDNTSALFNYIITPLSPISTSMIDNDRRIIFKIELRPNFIPDREFVYAVALTDDQGNVYSLSSFKNPFNKVDDAGEIITIKHILASDEISGNDFNILSRGDDYVTREEFVSWISNHNHDERTVSKRELSDAITIIDDKKADNVLIGNLSSVPTADKSSVEKIFNEILNYLGDISILDSVLKNNIVDSIISLKTQIGDITDLDVLSNDLVSAINKLRQDILSIPEPAFADGTILSNVRWTDKVDHSYVGDISNFAGFIPGPNGTTGILTVMDCINEVRNMISTNLQKVTTITIDDTKLEKNYRSYSNNITYSGNFNVKLQKNGLNIITFKVTVNEVEGKNIKIDNVFIKEDIQENAWLKNPANFDQNLVDYLYGFAIVFYNGNLDFSLKSNKDKDGNVVFDKIILEYQNMYASSNNGVVNMTIEPFDFNGSIPLKEDSGLYVRNPYNKFNIPLTNPNTKYTILDTKRKIDATVRLKRNKMVLASFKVRSEGQGDVKIYDSSYRPFNDVSSYALDKTKTIEKPISVNDGIFSIDTYSISGHYKTEFFFTVSNRDNILDKQSLNVSKSINSNLLITEVSSTRSSVRYSVKIDPSLTVKSTTEQLTVSLNGLQKTIDIDIDNRPRTIAELRNLCNINTLSLYDINTELLTDMSSAFENSTRTNSQFTGIETWDVSNVTNFSNMFKNAVNFNHDITGLSVDSKWITTNATNMSGMFEGATSFNQDISGWNTESLLNVDRMFKNATSFNQNINNWRLYNLESVNNVFDGCNYRADWSITEPVDMLEFSKYVNCKTNLALLNVRNITDMSNAFERSNRLAVNFVGIETWDVSNVTNMSNLFKDAEFFNNDISNWNVSNVTDMSGMFTNALEFNQSLNNWNVSNVTDMSGMFEGATSFNGSLNNWQTNSLTLTTNMFKGCIEFNQPLNHLNMSLVTDSSGMFSGCSKFNQPLNNWNTSTITNMTEMFKDCTEFNQNINNWKIYSLLDRNTNIFSNCPTQPIWLTLNLSPSNISQLNSLIDDNPDLNIGNIDVSAITDFSSFFYSRRSWPNNRFDGIGQWDVSSATSLERMFRGCTNFNQPLDNWNVSNVTNINFVFESCTNFNQPLNNWNVSNVTTARGAFYNCPNFNQPLDNWNVINISNMLGIFEGCTRFNQNINNWNVSNVTNMEGMFHDCTNFNQPLDNWNISNVENMNNFLKGCRNFNSSLNGTGWIFKENALVTSFFEGCTNFNQPLNNWNVSKLTNMGRFFYNCTNFNGDISNWDVSNVTNFTSTFESCTNFNVDISNWDMTSANILTSMFRGCTNFNQPLNNWNVSNVTNFNQTFDRATSFNKPLDSWDTTNAVNMYAMFWGTTSFNQNLNTWNVLNVTNKTQAFQNSPTQPWWYIKSPRPTTKEDLLYILNIREVKLNHLDIVNITDISEVFENSDRTSDQFIGLETWNTRNVTNMDRFCKNATNMNVNLDNWVLNENVTMVEAFDGVMLQPDWYKYNLKPTTKQELMIIISDLDIELDHIDTSLITDMSGLFENSTRTSEQFNGIETWDVSNVTNMDNMFKGATNFDKDLSDWNVISLTTLVDSFEGCIEQPWWYVNNIFPSNRTELDALITNPIIKIGLIKVDNVDDFSGLFLDSTKNNDYFEGLNNWRLTSATNITNMFKGASNFNQPLDNWTFNSNIINMSGMFEGATSFNQDISGWDVSNIVDFTRMFKNATSFNQNINNWSRGLRSLTADAFFNCPTQPSWYSIKLYKPRNNSELRSLCSDLSVTLSDIDTSLITDMTRAFENSNRTLDQFTGIETWNVSNVTNMTKMFAGAINFNKPLSNWNTSSLTITREMFYNCLYFNNTLDGRFDFSNVTDASSMFNYARNFNQPLSHWDTSSLENIENMFSFAEAFNQNIDNWNVNSISNKLNAFENCPTQPSWYSFTMRDPATKDELVAILLDASIPLNTIRTSLITDMSGLFENSTRTNSQFTGIETWDVSNVTNFSNMFKGAVNFNKNLSKWKMTSATNIESMFEGCSVMEQELDIWNIQETVSMDRAFECTLTRPVWYNYGALPILAVTNKQDLQRNLDAYKGDLGRIDVSAISDFSGLFNSTDKHSWTNKDFRGIEKWNVSRGSSFEYIFKGCANFNRDIGNWNISSANYMAGMLQNCTNFNQSLNRWDMNGVMSIQEMFSGCTNFNQPLNNWDTSTITNMNRTFANCTNFDQNIDNWDVSNLVGKNNTFANCPTQPSWYLQTQNP